MSAIRIREARVEDTDFIVSLAPRLTECELPPWRDPQEMISADQEVLSRAVADGAPEKIVLVAEDDAGNPLGFIHLTTETDYYTRKKSGHISDVVVASAGEGRGVGRALMRAAEDWARARGYGQMTLNVFTGNVRARRLYEKTGYAEEWVKYIKNLEEKQNDRFR